MAMLFRWVFCITMGHLIQRLGAVASLLLGTLVRVAFRFA
jgi:hypothetical protein